jgi:hypothetical protein
MSGKTTLANEILKGKNFKEFSSIKPLIGRFFSYEEIPEWVLIDGCTEFDIHVANDMQLFEMLEFERLYSDEKITGKVPHFILITNIKLEIKAKI